MSVIIQGTELRSIALGRRAAKTQALSAATLPIFTIAGGEVLVTSFYLRATVTIAAAGGTLALQSNPTTGDTASSIVTATDLGTSDATAGTIIGVREQAVADASAVPFIFSESGVALTNLVVTTGQLELVGASGIDGTVEAVVTWIPLTDGATLVAA
ncbi:MAG TPA: hypothetical protein VJQ57_13710 [Acidimicrobiia bacterium]|nr:hypothetical protein [Acidimicrobiia bacterium]